MKKINLLRLLPLLALVVGLCLLQSSAKAQQDPDSSNSAAQQQQPQQYDTMSQTSDAQAFTGKIAKSGGKLVLKNSVTKSTYVLDDQDRAKQFEGKDVKVTGTLDEAANTIRVATIEPGD
jgi:flagellar basal body-associated protein FliL